MAVKFSGENKTDFYVGRRFGKVEVTDNTKGQITFLCDCGEMFRRGLKHVKAHIPMACKQCHKDELSAQNPIGKTNGVVNMRDNTPEEQKMINDFLRKRKKKSS